MSPTIIESEKQGLPLGMRRVAAMAGPYQEFVALLIPLIIYWTLVPGVSYLRRDVITPDNVCYIRNAQYLVEGQFMDSVSGYWSPMISWCMAPLILFGVDALHSARIVLALWGCGLVVASYFFMRSLAPRCAPWMKASALSLVAVSAVRSASYMISPDLLMFAILMAYFATLLAPNFLRRRRLQILCGILAGMAYLAKSYALPFFLAHFTFNMGLHWLVRRKSVSSGKITQAWLTSILAFALVAGPWIGVLSWKYGKLTIATAGKINHTIIGPEDKPRYHPYSQLFHIPPGRSDIWETPESMSYNHWSPFENRSYFVHQLKHTLRNSKNIVDQIGNYDVFRISLPALILLPIIMVGLGYRRKQFKAIWTLGTMMVYSSGFALVYSEPRYYEFFLLPICCIYVIGFSTDCFAVFARRLRMPSWCLVTVSLLAVASFAETSREQNWEYLRSKTPIHSPYREIATELEQAGCRGPIAVANKSMRSVGMFTAYHMDVPYAGCLSDENQKLSVQQKEARLREFGIETFIVSPKAKWWKEFHEQTSWKLKLQFPPQGPLKVYVRPDRTP